MLFLNRLQALAVGKDPILSVRHRTALHATVGGILYLVSKISLASGLQEHIMQVLMMRKASAPHLLPGEVFIGGDRSELEEAGGQDALIVDSAMLFILDEEELLKKSPEPKKGFGEHKLVIIIIAGRVQSSVAQIDLEGIVRHLDLTSLPIFRFHWTMVLTLHSVWIRSVSTT